MIIPGFLIALATFPGVIVHEFGHELACRLTGTRIFEVCYFRLGNPAGYVMHEPPTSVWKHMFIGVGPFIANTIIGFLIGIFASRSAMHSGDAKPFGMLITWLAVSIAMHSFPSTGDAKSIWRSVWAKGSPILSKIIGTPLVGLIYLGAVASIFWLDLGYGILIAWGIPKAIL